MAYQYLNNLSQYIGLGDKSKYLNALTSPYNEKDWFTPYRHKLGITSFLYNLLFRAPLGITANLAAFLGATVLAYPFCVYDLTVGTFKKKGFTAASIQFIFLAIAFPPALIYSASFDLFKGLVGAIQSPFKALSKAIATVTAAWCCRCSNNEPANRIPREFIQASHGAMLMTFPSSHLRIKDRHDGLFVVHSDDEYSDNDFEDDLKNESIYDPSAFRI